MRRIRRFAAVLVLASIVGLTGMALPVSQTHAARPGLDDPPSDDAGAWIELYVLLGGGQEPWTVVQWTDPSGAWNDVDGWRGGFDAIQNGVGYKSWWVGQEHFGEGPFRWIVYEKKYRRNSRSERIVLSAD